MPSYSPSLEIDEAIEKLNECTVEEIQHVYSLCYHCFSPSSRYFMNVTLNGDVKSSKTVPSTVSSTRHVHLVQHQQRWRSHLHLHTDVPTKMDQRDHEESWHVIIFDRSGERTLAKLSFQCHATSSKHPRMDPNDHLSPLSYMKKNPGYAAISGSPWFLAISRVSMMEWGWSWRCSKTCRGIPRVAAMVRIGRTIGYRHLDRAPFNQVVGPWIEASDWPLVAGS